MWDFPAIFSSRDYMTVSEWIWLDRTKISSTADRSVSGLSQTQGPVQARALALKGKFQKLFRQDTELRSRKVSYLKSPVSYWSGEKQRRWKDAARASSCTPSNTKHVFSHSITAFSPYLHIILSFCFALTNSFNGQANRSSYQDMTNTNTND